MPINSINWAPNIPPSDLETKSTFDLGPTYFIRRKRGLFTTLIRHNHLTTAPVVCLGPTGLWFEQRGSNRLALGQHIEMYLLKGSKMIGPMSAKVTDVRHQKGDKPSLMAVRFNELSLQTNQALGNFMIDLLSDDIVYTPAPSSTSRKVIDDTEQIAKIIESLFKNQCLGLIKKGGSKWGPLRAARTNLSGNFPLYWELSKPWPIPPFTIELEDHNSIYQIIVNKIAAKNGTLATPLPDVLVQNCNRTQKRVKAPTNMTISFDHPWWDGLKIITKKVAELSYNGVSFPTTLPNNALFYGLQIPSVTLYYNDENVFSGKASIRHLTKSNAPNRNNCCPKLICGLQLTRTPEDPQTPWLKLVNKLLHPNT